MWKTILQIEIQQNTLNLVECHTKST